MISQKSLYFPLDQLLDQTTFEMDVDALIQPPDKGFLDNYLTSLQAQANQQQQGTTSNTLLDQEQGQSWIQQLGIDQGGNVQQIQQIVQPTSVPPSTVSPFLQGAPVTTGFQGGNTFSIPQVVTTGEYSPQFNVSDLSLGDLDQEDEEVQQPGGTAAPAIDKSKKRRIRSAQQQKQNKLAQQRYRERRKQRYTEMESMVSQLQVQLDTMKKVEQQLEEMQGQRESLYIKVQEQENEIAKLRAQVKQLTLSGGVGVADEQLSKCENSEAIGDLINEKDINKVKEDLKTTVASIRQIMNKYHLLREEEDGDMEPAAGASIDADDLRTVGNLVCRSMAACMKLYQDASHPMMCPRERSQSNWSHMEKFSSVKCPIAKCQWEKCLQTINLTETQKQLVLKEREQFLDQMREIYGARDKLNLTAMGMMLPHWSKEYNPTAEGRMQTVERHDFYYFARWDAELGSVLDELRLNLRAEQKAFLIFSKNVMANVLQLLQRALLVVTSYPLPVDILGVANTLYLQQTQQISVESAQSTCPC
eukprot:TRINITY_DN4411_c0_g1_i2.p1 TRINITY_DN4411_c0_g1~~TRINITY_DN4411_c0_g1_i2.p1  ORF type:complete len:607 (-),score=102.76 TRINITY_DN4411_c0_g1_i2:360-1955(-)